jgi:hypothetical protein
MFECLPPPPPPPSSPPHLVELFERIGRCGLVGGDVSLEVVFEVSKAQPGSQAPRLSVPSPSPPLPLSPPPSLTHTHTHTHTHHMHTHSHTQELSTTYGSDMYSQLLFQCHACLLPIMNSETLSNLPRKCFCL